MNTSSYNLITPVKNEEQHLPKLAECVIHQSLLPEVWIIVDDGSTDRTSEIINHLTTEHAWIRCLRIVGAQERTFGSHLFEVFRMGLEKSIESSGDVEYLINSDADVRFHDDTFRILCEKMDMEEKLAIASPRLMTLRSEVDVAALKRPETILGNKKLIITTDRNRIDEPTNGIRIYRKRFLDEIGGFPVNDAADDMVLGKAIMRGYGIGFVDGLWGYLTRETGTTLSSSYVRGKVRGYRLYIMHYHPLLVAAALIWDAFSKPTWAMGVFAGYLESLVRSKKRIDDADVIRYYGKERFRKVWEFMKGRVNKSSGEGGGDK